MISLALRGKTPISEDVLTAALFDHLRRVADPALFRAMLHASHPQPELPSFEAVEIELWPRTKAGEPDVRVHLREGASTVETWLIEAKLGAGKSGEGEVAADYTSGDQLARYLIAEAAAHPARRVSLLYLTHHAGRPDEDLAASAAHLSAHQGADLAKRLHWLSWCDVEGILASTRDDPYLGEVRELLRRAGMYRFKGMQLTPLGELLTTSEWRYGTPYRWTQAPTGPVAVDFYKQK